MEERKNLVDFSDDEIITLHKDLEKRIMNMEKLTEEEILMWNETLSELLRRDMLE